MMAERKHAAVSMMKCLRRRSSLATWYSHAERLEILVVWFPLESIHLVSFFKGVRHGRVKIVIRNSVLSGNQPKPAERK